MTTRIEWVARPGTIPESWNPIGGCEPISAGCYNCWAARMAGTRLSLHPRYAGLTEQREDGSYRWTGEIRLDSKALAQPLHWRKPRTVLVCSMSDLFHESVPDFFIWYLWWDMAKVQQHIFLILTKRPQRMLRLVKHFVQVESPGLLPNVWLGITVENQATADERRAAFEAIPAAIKFVSYESALGPIDWTGWEFVDQIISGGETGPGARPSHPDWHRATWDFCQEHGIAYFFKSWGAWFPRSQWEDNPYLTLPDDCDCVEGRNLRIVDDNIFHRVGKKRAGHFLDGQEWHQWPEVNAK